MALAIRGKKETKDGENNDEDAGAIRLRIVSRAMRTISVIEKSIP
jgi:hypothetical protein